MKLTPIDIEKALELSVAEPPPPTKKPMGRVEHALRTALSLFGPSGERWIKGTAQKYVGARRVAKLKPMKTSDFLFTGNEAATYVEHEIVELGEYAYCVLGALDSVIDYAGMSRRLDSAVAVIECSNPALKHMSIPAWNDAPERTFDDVKSAFERAIHYAHARGL